MIKINEDSIINVIDTKIETYQKILSDIMSSEEKKDRKLAPKYRCYLKCLIELRNELFLSEHTVFETLRMNYERYDTEFIFLDDSSYTVKKDDICSFKDNYVLIHDKEEFEVTKNCSKILEAINLDNVKLVKTLS